MLPEQWDDLEAWAKNLKGPGVLVLPQPLLKAGGSKTDRTLRRLPGVRPLRRDLRGARSAARTPHDILILTGDIHTGRLSSAEIVGLPGEIYELVASPRLAGHAVAAAVGPQAVGAAGQADRSTGASGR